MFYNFIFQILDGKDFLPSQRIVHNELKPQNLLSTQIHELNSAIKGHN